MTNLWRAAMGALIGLAIYLLPSAAWAQYEEYGPMAATSAVAGPGMISGHGMATVKKPPTAIRMHLLLSAKGKTMEDALANLKERREAAEAFLEKLGADKKSIESGSPSISQEDEQRQRQLQMMIRQRMRGNRAAPKAAKTQPTVSLASFLTAQWPVEAKNSEELLLTVHKLQQKIKEAKLATGKDDEKKSAEEEELSEEMAQESFGPSEDRGDPNEPAIAYLAQVSAEERDKAMADAFQKAKTNAERLAQAAGVRLGSLSSLGGGFNSGSRMQYGYPSTYNVMPRAMRAMMERGESPEQETRENQAVSSDPREVVFSFSAAATFRLATPAGKQAAEKAPAK